MVDWAGHDGTGTADRYRRMGRFQVRGVSPSYERLCLGVAGDPAVLDRLHRLPAPRRQPNLLFAAVRFLGGPVADYPAFRDFVLAGWDELSATMATRRTQTNEPRRCATLVPVLAALPQPLALLEVGASAGLCLHPDRYAYRYGDAPTLGSSRVVLDCAVSGPVPVPAVLPIVVWRRGLDLNPLDVRDEEDVRWLEALIWPEQTDRFAILRAAVEIARAEPATISSGDLTADLVRTASAAPASATLVVYHSAVLAYLDDAERARFRGQLDRIAATRSVVWVSNEGPGVCVEGPAPDGPAAFLLARDGVPLAHAGPHGEWLRWGV